MNRETVYILAETRAGAERCAQHVRSGHFESYEAATKCLASRPLPERTRLRVFDVDRAIAPDGEITLLGAVARAGCIVAGFAMMIAATGWGSLI